jgi:hypothetical protein
MAELPECPTPGHVTPMTSWQHASQPGRHRVEKARRGPEPDAECEVQPAGRTCPRESVSSLKGAPQRPAWLDELAVRRRPNKSMLIDLALTDHARKAGFLKAPPRHSCSRAL